MIGTRLRWVPKTTAISKSRANMKACARCVGQRLNMTDTTKWTISAVCSRGAAPNVGRTVRKATHVSSMDTTMLKRDPKKSSNHYGAAFSAAPL